MRKHKFQIRTRSEPIRSSKYDIRISPSFSLLLLFYFFVFFSFSVVSSPPLWSLSITLFLADASLSSQLPLLLLIPAAEHLHIYNVDFIVANRSCCFFFFIFFWIQRESRPIGIDGLLCGRIEFQSFDMSFSNLYRIQWVHIHNSLSLICWGGQCIAECIFILFDAIFGTCISCQPPLSEHMFIMKYAHEYALSRLRQKTWLLFSNHFLIFIT